MEGMLKKPLTAISLSLILLSVLKGLYGFHGLKKNIVLFNSITSLEYYAKSSN